jgi:hypothetical protein
VQPKTVYYDDIKLVGCQEKCVEKHGDKDKKKGKVVRMLD